MNSIEPRSINQDIVITDKEDDEAKQNNAEYAIAIARKLGAIVFLVWEDIDEVKSKLLLTFLASIYDLGSNYKPSNQVNSYNYENIKENFIINIR